MTTGREVYQGEISMSIQTTRSTANAGGFPHRPDTTVRAGASGRSAPIGALIASALCLTLGSWPLHASWGQTRPSSNRQTAKATGNRDSAKQTTPGTAVTPEYSSSDADYAVTGLLSRTTTQTDEIDDEIPWGAGLTRRLWENRMSAPDPNEDADSRAALNDLIYKVRSVRFEGDEAGPAFSAPADPTAPVRSTPPAAPLQRPQPSVPEPMPIPSRQTEPDTPLAPAALARLGDVLSDPSQVRDPLEMAELLFLSGRQTEATVFYERALALTVPNNPSTENDRAWILFQLGNCLRETDMTRARDMYMKLVSEYPGSPWTELAKAHGRLITWYQSARPQQLMP